ncbi:MAG: VCBS repeat-containing protein [Phycisphaeraceae bacterium]|nr:VCBS repeat-containing protein [Phycisphaeraceae bacterium]
MKNIPPYRMVIQRLALLLTLCPLIAQVALAQSLGIASGKPLPAGEGIDQLFSPNAYRGYPLGAAKVTGGQRPDIFLTAPNGIERGFYICRYLRDGEHGEPVFAAPVSITHPFGDKNPPTGTVYQDDQGRVHGFWLNKGKLTHSLFDAAARTFKETNSLDIPGLPNSAGPVAIHPRDGHIEIIYTVGDGTSYRPEGDDSSTDYVLYDGTGAFRGGWPYIGLYRVVVDDKLQNVISSPALFSQSKSEILSGSQGMDRISYPQNNLSGYIAGSRLGEIYLFPQANDAASMLSSRIAITDPDGNTLRHPISDGAAIVYPNASGQAVDLIVGGEGGLFYYRFTGKFTDDGRPMYERPVAVLEAGGNLFTGTLPVPTVADLDGDGAADILCGNSAGFVLFFKNLADNAQPRFGHGVPLQAGGHIIHIQPGYHGIQGPFEARWGYTCPTAADWNGDGTIDLLLGDTTGNVNIYINRGSPTEPKLEAAHPIYKDGLELRGTWRVKPGVAQLDGRMALFILDDDNALHLYWRIDDYNVADGGKLHMTDGSDITAHPGGEDARPGNRGRSKIEAVDWDGDGQVDLLMGGAKRNSVPDPETGQPWLRYRTINPCLQTVLLRNVGSNAQPVYERPKVMQILGQDLTFGAHSQSPAACPFGNTSGGPSLIYGMESGHLYYFAHRDVNFIE